ncbi:MAG: hypothetical protein LBU89_07545 [Fibromonadaceae bacterium]|nr:hypothetical protein [Fibromonadaceae bacterium]
MGFKNNCTSTPNNTVTRSFPLKEKINKKEKKNDYSQDFEIFWAAYPNKQKKPDSSKAFRRAFERHKDLTLETLLSAIKKEKTSDKWQKQSGKFIPHPSTWLNNDCWNDVLTYSKDAFERTCKYPALIQPQQQPERKPLSPEEIRIAIGGIQLETTQPQPEHKIMSKEEIMEAMKAIDKERQGAT